MTTIEAGTFDAEAALRLAIAGTRKWMGQEYDAPSIRQQFVTGMAMVCGWSGQPIGALLAAVCDPPLEARQQELLPEIQRRAEALSAAVAALSGTEASHDQRLAAVRTVVEYRQGRIPGGGFDPVWYAMHEAVEAATKELVGAQPADVRQVLFDAWTVPEGGEEGRSSLIRTLVRPGDLDGSGWLDRLGGRTTLRVGNWGTGLSEFTWEALRAAHRAGQPHAAALATWRRTRAEDDPKVDDDTSGSMWPIPNVGEPWADRAIADIEALPANRRAAWHALLVHCPTEREKARASAGWLKRARPLLDAVGADDFTARVDDWLPLVGLARTLPLRIAILCCWDHFADHPPRLVDSYNVGLLLGLIRLRMTYPPTEETLRSLGRIAERATRKIAGRGPANPKLANAAAAALVDADHPKALAQLARLASRLTYKSTLAIVQKGLTRHAEALGVSREDVEEMALPGFGLPLAGTLDDTSYEVQVRGVTAAVVWRSAAGKVLKAPPAPVRREHGEEVKELTAAAKDISAALLAARDRLEGLLRRDRSWTVEQWRARFLDHPLAGTLARRLIWTVDGVACCWGGDALRSVDDTVVEPADDATVRLWHPVGGNPAEVPLWRDFVTRHGITQPFKQAHREQYLLTDAERATGTYSNRFAAHIVRQHRLNAVLSRRGWAYVRHRQDGSNYDPPSLALPDWDLRAELAVAGIDVGDDFAVFDTMATDQLSFLGADRSPVPLEQVPAVVLSEVMREVDLFVTVAGIGSDPTWYDGGRDGRHRDYWGRSSFGALTQSGETRREVLAGLIPRLAVADRCTLTDMYLEVRGDLHAYRIHCGSGNILIAPENRYLCIIPDSAKLAKEPEVYLPFEGDSRLSEIISKALLLAADKKIKDPVILRQLE